MTVTFKTGDCCLRCWNKHKKQVKCSRCKRPTIYGRNFGLCAKCADGEEKARAQTADAMWRAGIRR